MRIATYNIQWFSRLFDEDNALCLDQARSGRHGVSRARQADAIARVLQKLDADAVMIIEAPDCSSTRNTIEALDRFSRHFKLRTRRTVMGFVNDTQQEIALLYDPDKLMARHDPRPTAPDVPRFDGQFQIDLDIDARADTVLFSKPPLELALETCRGSQLRLIGVHLKSKAPHGARTQDEVISRSIANRRKQLAQAIWLRWRIDQHLEQGDALIVLGDLNDGPGLDSYEHLFGRSSVEIVLGHGDPETRLFDPHANLALERRLGAHPTTARFFLQGENRFLQALLDYAMLSSNLIEKVPKWRIWHPFDDADCWGDVAMRGALLDASDHFPVSVDLDI